MKVLQVHNRYRTKEPSGEDRVVDQEAAALAAAGHDVERFERFSDDIEGWSHLRRLSVPGRLVWSTEAHRSLTETLRRLRPDVVHVHNTFPLVSPSVLHSCQQSRVPAVVTFHNYRPICPSGTLFRDGAVCHDCVGHLPLPGIRHGCYRDSALATTPLAVAMLAHRRLWRTLVSAYVFISASERDLFRPLELPDDRVFVKWNLVPAQEVPGVAREHKVAYLGRWSDTKGLPVLMEAWDRFSRSSPTPRLRLAVAGAGPLGDRVRDWSRQSPGVDVLGLLDRAACMRVVASARAVIVPSVWEETFGLVVVEGKAAGVPAVVSARGSLVELVSDGVDGICVEPGNAAALAELLHEVDVAPERFEELGRNARRSYEERFAPERNLEALLAVYRFAIERPIWRRQGHVRADHLPAPGPIHPGASLVE